MLLVAEYNTVREEWLQARASQQQTFQWTLATIGVIFAASLSADLRHKDLFLYILSSGGIGIVSVLSSAIWFGEVARMERAAMFLRGREASLMTIGMKAPNAPGLSPLLWESYRAQEPGSKSNPWVPKNTIGVFSGCALYWGLAAGAIIMLGDAALNDPVASTGEKRFALVIGSIIVAWLVGIALRLARLALRIRASSHLGADLDQIAPSRSTFPT